MFKWVKNIAAKLKISEVMSLFIILFLIIGAVFFFSIRYLGEALDMANTENLPAMAAVQTFEADNDRINLLINYAVSEMANRQEVTSLLVEINNNKADFQQQFKVLEAIGFGRRKAVIDKMAPAVKEFVSEVEVVNDFLAQGQKDEAEASVDYLNDTTFNLKESIAEYKDLVTQHIKQDERNSIKLHHWSRNAARAVILIMAIGLGLGLLGFGTLIHQRDLEIKEQREELLHVTRVGKLSEFVSSLAHEISQPLSAILSYAQGAKRMLTHPANSGAGREPQMQEILGHIINDGQRAGEVIRRLRTLVKKSVPEMRPFDMNALINETVTLIEDDFNVKNTVLKRDLDTALPFVYGDRIQLQQVLLNLISNGFDAMEGSSGPREMVVRTSCKNPGTILVEVNDSGCGISAQNRPKLFTHFFTSKLNGLGMGLSISRSIVEAHGGRLDAKNNPDRGANFYFTIPVAPKEPL